MAIVNGDVYTCWTGKVANIIQQKQPGAMIQRNYTIGVDPQTPMQIDRRMQNSAVLALWQTLNLEHKRNWNIFALNEFQSMRRQRNQIHSGYNTFMSKNNRLYSAVPKQSEFTSDGTWTFDPIPINTLNPKKNKITPTMYVDSSTIPVWYKLNITFINLIGTTQMGMNFNQDISGSVLDFRFYDSTEKPIIYVYISQPLSSGTFFVKNPRMTLLCTIGNFYRESDFIHVTGLGLQISVNYGLFQYNKMFPYAGTRVGYQIYLGDNYGNQIIHSSGFCDVLTF